ncbi:MAG TPA: hypothetical protein VFB50_15980 [Chloroflexota bacterium]|nr:hypothetical protein [Chloroflexota bacterium]
MQLTVAPVTIGWIIALITLIVCVVLVIIGLPDARVLIGLIAALAVARLL